MVNPRFLLVLLLLARTHAIKFECGVQANKPLHYLIEPGFEVNTVKVGTSKINPCQPNSDANCYEDMQAADVQIVLTSAAGYTQLKFTGKNNAEKTFQLKEDGTTSGDDIAITKAGVVNANGIKLPFVPEKMFPVKDNAPEGDGGKPAEKPCDQPLNQLAVEQRAVASCFFINKKIPKAVKVTAKIAEEAVTVTLTDTQDPAPPTATIEAKFVPVALAATSAATWLSQSAALLVTSLATQFFLH